MRMLNTKNSKIKYGIDFKQPMLFNEFLNKIGSCLTALNCKWLFSQETKWYIYTSDSDEIINKYYKKKGD